MKIVIQGAGEVGSHLAKMLSHEANEITVIDDNAERLAALTAIADISTILSPPSSIKGMRDADIIPVFIRKLHLTCLCKVTMQELPVIIQQNFFSDSTIHIHQPNLLPYAVS